MASDSRVSGSEDAKSPGQGSDDAPQTPAERAGGETTPRKPAASEPAGTPGDRPAKRASTNQPARQTQPAKSSGPTADQGAGDDAQASEASDGEASNGESFWAQLAANRFLLLNAVPSWMVSMVIHAVLLMVLALMTLPERLPAQRIVALSNPSEMEEIENLDQEDIDPLDVEVFEGAAPAEVMDERTTTADYDVPALDDVSAAPEQIKLEGFGEMSALPSAMLDRVGGGVGSGLGEVRGARARRAMVEKYGGSAGSEAAVAAALKWLSEHQLRDGGWDFDHTKGACKGRCTHPGIIKPARNGATAMALLPFLGAGQTHKEGQYKETVERGLAYLIRSMKLGNGMGDLTDAGGRMYSHGLASIALCEAFAMTNDPGLLQPAQLSLNFIVYAQDPIGGGWRYKPRQAGDTSVLGWQLMACKSGHMAYLKVPSKTILGASKFLDFVQMDNGATYGYTMPAQGRATTAVGLLCRMYLGWKHDNQSLMAGVEYLDKLGPSNNMYYNYYATQVMRHYGGEYWERWNSKMRDRLVRSQETSGHAKGSWFFSGGKSGGNHANKGGRLYCTSMATMILEVYYRHMPIYGKQAAEEEFPL